MTSTDTTVETQPAHPGADAFVDLAADPFGDDLRDQLAAAAPRRWTNRATLGLAGAVLLVGGFLAGAQVQKNFGVSATAAGARPAGVTASGGPNAAGGGFGNRAGGTGTGTTGGGQVAGGTRAGGAPATTGTVRLVDGTTVYLQTADGQVITVRTDGQTAVQVAGSLKDLAVGSTVSVQGQTGTDGTVTATSVTKAK